MGRLTGLAVGLAAAVVMSAGAAPAFAAGAPAGIDTLPTPANAPPDRPAGKAVREPRVFISPSGEPFRQSPSEPDPLKAWFEQVDVGHKGYVDRADFRADATRFFKKLDENGDGVIDGFEVADYEAKIAPELAEWAEGQYPGQFGSTRGQGQGDGGGGEGRQGGHRRGGRGGEGPQDQGSQSQEAQQQDARGEDRGQRGKGNQRGVFQLINEPEPVSGADFSLDSHITLDEWMRATDRRFQILDANKDGRITLEELRARFLPTKK